MPSFISLEEQESLLSLVHAEDFRADGASNPLEQLAVALCAFLDLHDFLHLLIAKHVFSKVLLILGDLTGLNMSVVDETLVHSCEPGVWRWHVDTCYLHNVSW
jgi:hypothetical protein